MANQLVTRLTTKVGPLPAWAWAAIPATAYVAWSYYKASQGDSYISDVEDTGELSVYDPVGEYGINSGGAYLPGYGTMPDGTSNLPPVEAPKPTNQTWFRQASNYLISEGFQPKDIITALNAYLYGTPDKINSTQMNALQRALIFLGAAPEPAFIPAETPNTPNPVPKPPTPPTPKPPTPKPPAKVTPAPKPPINLKLVKSGVSGIYRATWQAPKDGTRPDSYVVQKQFNAGSWTSVATGASWFADMGGIKPNGLLTIRVAAVAGGKQSGWATKSVRT